MGLLDSIWPYIPPGFRQGIFGGNDYAQAQPSPGVSPGPAPSQRMGLLGPLLEMSPGADIRDSLQYGDSGMQNLFSGNIGKGLLDMAYVPASLAGIMLPGSSSQYRQAGGAVTDALNAPRRIEDPIKAYHGSPHDFDQFDMSKIGTGEGAQAYGHGLYFAENEGVARSYRDALSPPPGGNPVMTMAYKISGMGGDVEKNLRRIFPDLSDSEILAAVAEVKNKPLGHTYEVAIHARPEEFLDWDAPANAQTQAVQDAIRANDRVVSDGTMATSYYEMALAKDSDGSWRYNPELASSRFRDAGIPGIKYLDQGSRGAGDGTRNYVLFDDKLIEILRKYGILAPLFGGAATATGLLGSEDQY